MGGVGRKTSEKQLAICGVHKLLQWCYLYLPFPHSVLFKHRHICVNQRGGMVKLLIRYQRDNICFLFIDLIWGFLWKMETSHNIKPNPTHRQYLPMGHRLSSWPWPWCHLPSILPLAYFPSPFPFLLGPRNQPTVRSLELRSLTCNTHIPFWCHFRKDFILR